MRRTLTHAFVRLATALPLFLGCDLAMLPAGPVEDALAPTLTERLANLRGELPRATDGLTHSVAIEGSSANFDPLRAALEGIVATDVEGELEGPPRRAHIVMLGASHVAGDLVSGYVRDRLQRHFGDAGHGFVSAVPPFDDYWQWGVEVREGEGWAVVEATHKFHELASFGPNGMAFDAFEPAWAALRTEHASSLALYFARQPAGGALDVVVDGEVHAIRTDAELVEAAVERFEVPEGAHEIRLETRERAPVRIYGMSFEREVAGVVVDQLGLNAATAAFMLQNEEASQRVLLEMRDPDLFVIWLGNNEATEGAPIELQTERFHRVIERLRAAMPRAGCLVIGPLDRRQHDLDGHPFVPEGQGPIAAMHREIALQRGCAFYDALAWQGGEGAVERFEAASPALIRDDRVHLTHEGYLRFGADLLRALLAQLEA
jgi:lysophospholipase L1-like esterase